MKERQTRQLAAVYEVVCAARDHPTADEVCARVRRVLPQISLGTVYRNLQKLAAQRQLRIVHLADRTARYDAMLDEHDHFLCEHCGEVIDLQRQPRARPRWGKLARAGYGVRAQALTFYGLCPDCAEANRRQASPRPFPRARTRKRSRSRGNAPIRTPAAAPLHA